MHLFKGGVHVARELQVKDCNCGEPEQAPHRVLVTTIAYTTCVHVHIMLM